MSITNLTSILEDKLQMSSLVSFVAIPTFSDGYIFIHCFSFNELLFYLIFMFLLKFLKMRWINLLNQKEDVFYEYNKHKNKYMKKKKNEFVA